MISSVIDTSGVAVVTGGASGLGFEVASRLSRAGMAVVILDVASTADLAAAEAALIAGAASSNDTHPSAMAVRCDVTQFAACRAAAAAVEAAFPRRRITFLHNNAGIMGDPAAGQILAGPPPDKNWANIFAVNVFGTANILKAFLPGIIESGAAPSGKPSLVVTTSSVVGLVNHIPGPYSLSKFAVTAMCEQLSHELDAMGPAAAHISPHSLHPTIAATGLFGGGAKAARALEASGVTTAGAIIDGLFRGLDEGKHYIIVDGETDIPSEEQITRRFEDQITGRRPRVPQPMGSFLRLTGDERAFERRRVELGLDGEGGGGEGGRGGRKGQSRL